MKYPIDIAREILGDTKKGQIMGSDRERQLVSEIEDYCHELLEMQKELDANNAKPVIFSTPDKGMIVEVHKESILRAPFADGRRF